MYDSYRRFPRTVCYTAGHIPSGWSNHPQGVTASLVHEWVSQRYLDKATQVWGNWSTPGIS